VTPSGLVIEQGGLTNSNEQNGGGEEQWHEKDEFRVGVSVAGAVVAAGIGSLVAFLIVKKR
jgi:hypothetical protein